MSVPQGRTEPYSLTMSDVVASIVTKGDQDISRILDGVPFPRTVVWDNSRGDAKVFGRYLGIYTAAEYPVAYVQDDDVVFTAWDQLLAAYEPGAVVCNMPAAHRAGEAQALVGWGSIFDTELPALAFQKWMDGGGRLDDVFLRCCDIVFTVLTPFMRVDLGHEELPWSHDSDRMHRQEGYHEERTEILEKALEIAHSLGRR